MGGRSVRVSGIRSLPVSLRQLTTDDEALLSICCIMANVGGRSSKPLDALRRTGRDMNGQYMPTSAPIFILACPRSGSTLLATLLGLSPAVSSPPESNMSVALEAYLSVRDTLRTAAESSHERKRAIRGARRVGEELVRRYLEAEASEVLCDKSLSNVGHASMLAEVFPKARFVCLYRHCLDVIASLIEANPWGFGAFGAAPYIARWPTNFVAGLSEMWLSAVGQQRAFTEEVPGRVWTLRYEDLVADPVAVMHELFAWVGLPTKPISESAAGATIKLPVRRDAGPADFKIAFTSEVSSGSVGRGRMVPIESLPSELMAEVNRNLVLLNYDAVSSSWNVEAAPEPKGVEVRNDVVIIRLMEESIARLDWPDEATGRVVIHLEDVRSCLHLDFTDRRAHVEKEGEIDYISRSLTIIGLATGEINVGVAMRRGEFRVARADLSAGADKSEWMLHLFRNARQTAQSALVQP